MAQFKQLGSPFSLSIATPALTLSDLMEASFNFNPELHEHFNGASRFPRFTIGNDETSIKFRTTDKAAIAALIKGLELSDVVLTFKGTYTGVTTAPTVTQAADQVSATISCMRVVEAVEISNDSEKKPAEFEFTLRAAAKEADGLDPTIEFSYEPVVTP